MGAAISLALVNLPAFVEGLRESQTLQLRFMRTELKRGAQRIRKHFIREQLQGLPGIKAGKLAKGRNVFTFVHGKSPDRLQAEIGISRILHVHEAGLTITPQKADALYLSKKTGTAGQGNIFATAQKVIIPARLKFRERVAADAPEVLAKVGDAGLRASQVAMTKALKKTVGL